MEQENVDAQFEVVEQEEITSQEEVVTDAPEEEVITIPKAKFMKMQRKAIAFDANNKPKPITNSSNQHKGLDDEIVKTVKSLEQIENKRQFGYENELSPEETDAVFKFANGKPTKETLEHPFVKAGIESLRSAKRAAANIPGPSSRSTTYNGKKFEELEPSEKQKAFEDRMKNVAKK